MSGNTRTATTRLRWVAGVIFFTIGSYILAHTEQLPLLQTVWTALLFLTGVSYLYWRDHVVDIADSLDYHLETDLFYDLFTPLRRGPWVALAFIVIGSGICVYSGFPPTSQQGLRMIIFGVSLLTGYLVARIMKHFRNPTGGS